MIKALLFILLAFPFKTEEQVHTKNLIGKWKLIQSYEDPGDGSGDFLSVKSSKIVEFYTDGKIISNGSLCLPFYHYTGEKSEGNYSQVDKSITVTDCTKPTKLVYELKNGFLIIYYVCKEGCAEKYQKIE